MFIKAEYLKYKYFHSLRDKSENSVIKKLYCNSDGTTTVANMYGLSEIYDPLYINKKRISGPKLLKHIILRRFNQKAETDKVLQVMGNTKEIPKFIFLYKLNYDDQQVVLRFLLQRFNAKTCKNYYSLKLCNHCSEYKDIEHLIAINALNFNQLSKYLLLYDHERDKELILFTIRQIKRIIY
jgi:hypothetical protein